MSVVDLSLNEGPWPPSRCRELLRDPSSVELLSTYGDQSAIELTELIAARAGVGPDNVFLEHGSGPLLQGVGPQIIRRGITTSPLRILRHVAGKAGFPVITPHLTYGKVVEGAQKRGLKVNLLPLDPPDFKLDLDDLDRTLKRSPGFVYLCNPNNPTGQPLFIPDELAPLIERHSSARFWIDEAYVDFLAETTPRAAPLVPQFDNLVVSRSFSFAYGLAGLRIGYLIAPAAQVNLLRGAVTSYRFGAFEQAMATAALSDEHHLANVRASVAELRRELDASLDDLPGLRLFPSHTNFVLGEVQAPHTAQELASELLSKGLRIKTIPSYPRHDHSRLIRLGLGREGERLANALRESLQ